MRELSDLAGYFNSGRSGSDHREGQVGRLLGRVGSAPRGASSVALAAEVGAPPWKIDRVRQQLRGWHPNGIARALHAVAEADAQVKGEAASAAYALERAVRRIVASRAGEDLS